VNKPRLLVRAAHIDAIGLTNELAALEADDRSSICYEDANRGTVRLFHTLGCRQRSPVRWLDWSAGFVIARQPPAFGFQVIEAHELEWAHQKPYVGPFGLLLEERFNGAPIGHSKTLPS
jgi:hypothetical protein